MDCRGRIVNVCMDGTDAYDDMSVVFDDSRNARFFCEQKMNKGDLYQ